MYQADRASVKLPMSGRDSGFEGREVIEKSKFIGFLMGMAGSEAAILGMNFS